jgi:uncharacterized integral membrane protein
MGLFRRRPDGPLEDWQPRLYAVLLAFVLLLAWMIAFVVKNDDRVKVDFVLFSAQTSLIWLIILPLALGFLGGALLSQLYRRRRRSSGSAQEHGGADS